MADNLTTQDATLATLPTATGIAAVQGTFSGDAVFAGLGVLAKVTGNEGSRVLTPISPATDTLLRYGADYVSYTATSPTVDTFVYKTGGSGGTTVATVTVTYTDDTHTVLVSVAVT